MTHVSRHPWPREATASPTYQLHTSLGDPFVRALSGSVVGVQGGIPHNTEAGAAGALTVNGIVYSVQAHFHRWSDGRYHAGPEDENAKRLGYNYREPSLSRRDSFKDASKAATDKARAVLEEAVNEWAEAHPDLLLAGEERKRAENAHVLARQLDECEANCAKLRANLDACTSGRWYQTYPLSS